MHRRHFAPFVLSCLVAAVGCDGSTGASADAGPDAGTEAACAPAAFGEARADVLVSARCAPPAGTSTAAPVVVGDLAAALAAAPAGGVILIDAGSYAGGLRLERPVRLVGRGAGQTVLQPAPGQPGVVVGAVQAGLKNLSVEGATAAGVGVAGGALTLDGVQVRGTVASPGGDDGHGVQATEGARLVLRDVDLRGNAGVGVLVHRSGLSADAATIAENARGGVAVVDGTFTPAPVDGVVDGTFEPPPDAVVDGTFVPGVARSQLSDNGLFGLALYGGALDLYATEVRGTRAGDGAVGGDGVLVVPGAGPSRLGLAADSAVRGSARAGLLVSGEGGAPGDAIAVVDGTFEENARSGVWAQGAGAELRARPGAALRANRYFGARATRGATLSLEGVEIARTAAAAWSPDDAEPVGDGVAVSEGAALTLRGGRLLQNDRAGLMARDPSARIFVVDGTFFEGGRYAVVVDAAPADRTWDLPTLTEAAEVPGAGNGWQGASEAALAEDLGLSLPDRLCAQGSCVPGG